MRKNFFYITMVIFVWFVAAQNTIAQTKLYDLSRDGLSVDFSPDGEYIVTGDAGGDVELWEVSDGERIYRRSIAGAIKGVAFSPNGEFIAAGGTPVANRRVQGIHLRTSDGEVVRRLNLVDDAKSINAVAYSPDGIHVAIGDDVGVAYLWNVNSGQPKAWTYDWEDNLYAVTFSPDGEYLATGDSDGYARIWEVDSWWGDVKVQSIELGGNVRDVAFSPNGRYLAVDQYDGPDESVYIYDVVQDRVVQQIDQGSTTGRGVTALAFSPDSRFLAVGNVDSEIKIYRIGTEIIASVTLITHEMTIRTSGAVEDLAWSPDSDLISDGKSVWRTDRSGSDDKPEIRLTLPKDFISEVAFGPNSTYFILNAQFPILTGVADTDVIYHSGSITVDLEGVPDNLFSDTLLGHLLKYLDKIPLGFISTIDMVKGFVKYAKILYDLSHEPRYFIFPLKTNLERLLEIELEAAKNAGIATASTLVGLFTGPGDVVAAGISFGSIKYERALAIDELLRSTMDPKIVLKGWGAGRPASPSRYVMLLPKYVKEIDIKVELVYSLKDAPLKFETLRNTFMWDLKDDTFSAPRMQPIALSDYPPFQLLPPEVQDSLLRYFSAHVDTAASRIPEATSLLPNYPNPFNPETWIPYQLTKPVDVTLTIYAADGVVVRTLALGHQAAGMYHNKSRAAYWDGRNEQGEPVASGVYFYTLTAGDFTATRKMLIRK